MIAYKLFRVRKNGTLASLFINRRAVIPVGKWLRAGNYPTKGFKARVGWHATAAPKAPHLSLRGRKWFKVEIRTFKPLERPESQGGLWYLANQMKVLEPC